MITITQRAARRINELTAAEGQLGLGIRLFVGGGGCSGFQYRLTFEKTRVVADEVIDDKGVRLYVDRASYQYLQGHEIDYMEDELGCGGFKIGASSADGP